jgi:hypothetical protein
MPNEQSFDRRAARKAARCSLDRAAALAGVSTPTARVWEADPSAVSEESRAKLEAFYLATFLPRAA